MSSSSALALVQALGMRGIDDHVAGRAGERAVAGALDAEVVHARDLHHREAALASISCRSPAAVMKVIRGIARPAPASSRPSGAQTVNDSPQPQRPASFGIAELEGGAELVLDEVHLGAEQVHHRLRVDHDLDPIGLDHLLARPISRAKSIV